MYLILVHYLLCLNSGKHKKYRVLWNDHFIIGQTKLFLPFWRQLTHIIEWLIFTLVFKAQASYLGDHLLCFNSVKFEKYRGLWN